MTDCATCTHHSGIEAELKAVCSKMNEREKIVNLRFEIMERDVILAKGIADRQINELVGALKELNTLLQPLVRATGISEGSRKWTDYLIMALISGAIVLIAKLIHL